MNKSNTIKRILLAEESPSLAETTIGLLTSRGYEVELARNGKECLDKVHSFHPSLVVVDVVLPKIPGIDVLKVLKSDPQTRGVGVLLYTANAENGDHDLARSLGAFDILSKPIEGNLLVETIERFFDCEAKTAESRKATAPEDIYRPVLRTDRPHYRLWGTRGSIPVSGQKSVRHGGNTSCLEFSAGEDLIVFDAGTGIRELGLSLAKRGPRKITLFLTHTHWDHIQGFPFFAPAYIPGFELQIYGAQGFRKDLNSVFRGQLDSAYFPVQFEDMRAKIEFHILPDQPLSVGNFLVSWEYTHHPAVTLAYKVETEGKKLAYVSDNEFLYGYLGAPHGITYDSPLVAPHRPLIDFVSGVDVLIHEAQYTNEEYKAKVGWGHSSISNGCVMASLSRAKRWMVTHHDPLHEDDFLDDKLNLTREVLRTMNCTIEVQHAHDTMMEYL